MTSPQARNAIPAELSMTTRAGRPTIWLEVVYDGVRPPRALFADLAMIGFDPPTEMPPPSSAMDWSTPDPTTGRAYTIRPHRIQATIDPPQGTGIKRSWTDSERAVFQVSLEGVLRRHGIDGMRVGDTVVIPGYDGLAAADGSASSTIAPEPPTTQPVLPEPESGVDEPEVVGFAAAVAIADPPTQDTQAQVPTPPAPVPVSQPDDLLAPTAGAAETAGAGWHRVQITSVRVDLADVLRPLHEAGIAARLTSIEHQVTRRFRGSEQVVTQAIPAIGIIVDDQQRALLEPILSASGIDPAALSVDVAPARPADLASFLTAAPSSDRPGPDADPGHPTLATIVALYEPRRSSAIDLALADAGVADRTYTEGMREIVSSFRGSEHVTNGPAVRLEARVDPVAVGGIVALISRLGALDASDERQLRVIPPSGMDGPAGDDGDDRTDAPRLGAVVMPADDTGTAAPPAPTAAGVDAPSSGTEASTSGADAVDADDRALPARRRKGLRLVG